MALLFQHDVRPRGSARSSRLCLPRIIRKLGAAFRVMHRAIAAAKVQRLRSELLLHRGQEDWEREVHAGLLGQDASRYPRQPVVLGEKWDY
ncbi:hypothetical protein [Bradyrhizobium lablabi]|uniref:hypothetical protein n=1 Tax=Bradyrhizobium lablabi TaxID=722472 RepID=UPI001BA85477|nr:hypothetical protein [Bradyrhizobium lablabi]MBR0697591.1 hypothetical protein [Bradyrhizobium lablabi]